MPKNKSKSFIKNNHKEYKSNKIIYPKTNNSYNGKKIKKKPKIKKI